MNNRDPEKSLRIYHIEKRIVDLVCSIIAIVLFSPVMLIIAIAIKINSKGPVYADMPKRVGRGGKLFFMYKFRSMFPNAHTYLMNNTELYEKYKRDNHKLSIEEDPRITKVGAFIRKTSLDELPQFFNVFKGEMSIVGPRAYFLQELNDQAEHYPQSKKLIKRALTIKPGITGPWQVHGRSNINFSQRIKLDSDYAKTHSIWYDIKMIIMTPYVVIIGKGVK